MGALDFRFFCEPNLEVRSGAFPATRFRGALLASKALEYDAHILLPGRTCGGCVREWRASALRVASHMGCSDGKH